jgi:hypothetical protein
MGKNGLQIGPYDQRGNGALRESPKMNSANTIPEETSQLTLIAVEINNTPDRPLTDLPKHPPRIHNKEEQRKNSESKGDVPVYECTIHLLKLTPF